MTILTTRAWKGSPLTNNEMDQNLNNLNNFKVEKTSNTGSAELPVGTTAERDGTPQKGWTRYNSTLDILEYWNGTIWVGSDNSGQLVGFRNKVINADCRVSQRPSTPSVLNVATYGACDRFFSIPAGFTTHTGSIQRIVGIGLDGGYAHALALTSTGSGYVINGQRIEAANTIGMKPGAAIVSGYIYQDTGAPVNCSVQVNRPNTADVFSSKVMLTTVPIGLVPSGTWTRFEIPFAPNITDLSKGLEIECYYNAIWAVTSKIFALTKLQVEEGSIATPFEQRPIGLELSLCQRYYEVISGTAIYGSYTTTGQSRTYWNFKATKRTTPTMVYVGGTGGTRYVTADGVAQDNPLESGLGFGTSASAEL